MENRCKVYRLATGDLDRSVDDPALGMMLSSGWSVVAPIVVEEKGEFLVALIMAPPVEPVNRKLILAGVFLLGVVATTLLFISYSMFGGM